MRNLTWLIFSGALMTFVGILVLGTGSLVLFYDGNSFGHRWSSTSSIGSSEFRISGQETNFQPIYLSFWLMGGSLLTSMGILLAVRRYSLRALTLAVFLIAALGAAPLIRGGLGANIKIDLTLKNPLDSQQIVSLREAMQPKVGLGTLPEELGDELGIAPGSGLDSVEISDLPGPPYLVICKLNFLPNLNSRQRATLADFYISYFKLLVTERAQAKSNVLKPGDFPRYDHQERASIWPRWKDAWKDKNGFREREAALEKNIPNVAPNASGTNAGGAEKSSAE